MNCTICATGTMEFFARTTVLGKHDVQYFRCRNCGFIRTEQPYWLEEAYSDAITGSDVGLVARNIRLARITAVLISCFFDKKGKFLDYAGGYGLFVRLMRDQGLDFRWHDKYCRNLFAKRFEASTDGSVRFELLTAFEVVEHLVDPLGELEKMLSLSPAVLFSTRLVPSACPKPGEWWYYSPEHGQHISFFTEKSLEIAASRLGAHFSSNGSSLHLISKRKLSRPLFYLLARHKSAIMLNPFLQGRSLLDDDFSAETGSRLQQ